MLANLKIEKQIQSLLQNTIITDRRYLDDEQLDRGEQFRVLDERENQARSVLAKLEADLVSRFVRLGEKFRG